MQILIYPFTSHLFKCCWKTLTKHYKQQTQNSRIFFWPCLQSEEASGVQRLQTGAETHRGGLSLVYLLGFLGCCPPLSDAAAAETGAPGWIINPPASVSSQSAQSLWCHEVNRLVHLSSLSPTLPVVGAVVVWGPMHIHIHKCKHTHTHTMQRQIHG